MSSWQEMRKRFKIPWYADIAIDDKGLRGFTYDNDE